MGTFREQPRHPSGTPVGGQWAPMTHDEADIGLEGPVRSALQRRARELREIGFAQPMSLSSRLSGTGLRTWWLSQLAIGEHMAGPGKEYPKMPDDETPSGGHGRSFTGKRRTHLRSYAGAGVGIRMPSVAAVRRYAAKLAEGTNGPVTFDVPVSASHPDGEVSGWVRVTRSPDGSWASRALGFPHDDKGREYISEGVQCLLEARRPTRALSEVGDLLERRRQRRSEMGVKLRPTKSTWVRQVGYDYETGTLVVSTGSHVYGYKAPERTYQAIANAYSPGRAYNLFVRGKVQRVDITECEKCGRYSAQVDGEGHHRCPPSEAPRAAMAARAARIEGEVPADPGVGGPGVSGPGASANKAPQDGKAAYESMSDIDLDDRVRQLDELLDREPPGPSPQVEHLRAQADAGDKWAMAKLAQSERQAEALAKWRELHASEIAERQALLEERAARALALGREKLAKAKSVSTGFVLDPDREDDWASRYGAAELRRRIDLARQARWRRARTTSVVGRAVGQ